MKILIIENQSKQFLSIRDYFRQNYYTDIFPDQEEYIRFIDYVKIWVYEHYDEAYKNYAIGKIKEYIAKHGIELIVMDFKLGSAYDSHTGIDLAEEIHRVRKDVHRILPVIFLSRTPENEQTRSEKYITYEENYGLCEWIHKGYVGRKMDADFFRARVLKAIQKLIRKEKVRNALEICDTLLKNKEFHPYGVEIKCNLEEIQKKLSPKATLPDDLATEFLNWMEKLNATEAYTKKNENESLMKKLKRYYDNQSG